MNITKIKTPDQDLTVDPIPRHGAHGAPKITLRAPIPSPSRSGLRQVASPHHLRVEPFTRALPPSLTHLTTRAPLGTGRFARCWRAWRLTPDSMIA